MGKSRINVLRTVVAIPAILCLAACGMSHDKAAASTAKSKSVKDVKPPDVGVTVSGPSTFFEFPDIKHPGRMLAKVWAKGFRSDAKSGTVHVTLTAVKGTLFDKGKPSATFSAPEAVGDNVSQIITATGRVTYTSLIHKGTWIQADRVKWSAKTSRGIATGNVVMRYGESGFIAHTSQLNFDTGLGRVESTAATATLP